MDLTTTTNIIHLISLINKILTFLCFSPKYSFSGIPYRRIVLQLLNSQFDFICLIESKIRKQQAPKTDISIDGYKYPVGMPTEALKGGVLIYVKRKALTQGGSQYA